MSPTSYQAALPRDNCPANNSLIVSLNIGGRSHPLEKVRDQPHRAHPDTSQSISDETAFSVWWNPSLLNCVPSASLQECDWYGQHTTSCLYHLIERIQSASSKSLGCPEKLTAAISGSRRREAPLRDSTPR